jgi:AcrR family transcriptional regulator
VASPAPQWPPPGRAAKRRRDPHRRQRILTAAATLVAERGYHDVGMADIGAAAGITGSAVYRHFDSKSAVLVAMFDAVVDDLAREAGEIAAGPADPLTALRGLIQTQVRFVLRDGALARVYHNEATSLPADDLHRLRRKQRLYLEEWVHALAQLRPGDGDAVLRALVHASVGAIQSTLFFHTGLPEQQLADLMAAVAEAALFAEPGKASDTRGLR